MANFIEKAAFPVHCKALISLKTKVCAPGCFPVVPGYPKSLKNNDVEVCVSPVIYIYRSPPFGSGSDLFLFNRYQQQRIEGVSR